MTILLIVLAFLLMLLVGLALLRLRIIIDTKQERFEARLIPLGSARLVIGDGTIGYQWRAVFVQREGRLFPPLEEHESKCTRSVRKRAPGKRKRRKPPLRKLIRTSCAMLNSFQVDRFQLRLDTGDPVWNAWLFPVFALWRSRGHDVAVQFVGGSSLTLEMENSVHRIAGVLIRSFITKTNGS